ncbi:DUF2169 family type VI secretion system accessory protein [Diaphorobacter caeni]|uniref:DUF2169 family type VI secretion system accessory protein n=1 Tax=Diaphorobacter caeni TaxID=2784387 RepID=UPI00188FE370|nr:DUF2169 domain-containing protein [Diaphorobacter caeni]MBF5005294.1 DUF2169 domain-containing protein [Diaphorobacter caeni]
MEFVCTSKHLNSAYITALDVSGREHLVVIAKASWTIPVAGQRPRPLPPQPLLDADEYYGEPGESALRCGDDYARFKPRCDVIFDAVAHAPFGKSVKELDVGVQVGALQKVIRVTGARRWKSSLTGWGLSAAEPFTSMPLHFGLAFGGTRYYEQRGQKFAEALFTNPVGQGWAGDKTRESMAGQAVANLAHPGAPIKRPDDSLSPIALSAIGRHWMPRAKLGGTYDDSWRREVAPFLPEDFDVQFEQAASEDQQVPHLNGGEEVQLIHILRNQPKLHFTLPILNQMKVRVLRKDFSTETLPAVADTLFFETEMQRFSVTWRASTPIRRRIQEFDTVAVGAVDPHWWHMKTMGLDVSGGCLGCAKESETT